nr:MAG TPA: hypothetical protein [Caudoviricetes sp.]
MSQFLRTEFVWTEIYSQRFDHILRSQIKIR